MAKDQKKENKSKKEKVNKGGRPKIPIDWSQIDHLAEAGCNGVQCADFFGVSYDTLALRFEKELKDECGYDTFSAYLRSKRGRGDALLLARQYKAAMSGCKTLLVWLGKNRLGQVDKKEIEQRSNKYVYIEKSANQEQEKNDDTESLDEMLDE